jgi:hypothetical protein
MLHPEGARDGTSGGTEAFSIIEEEKGNMALEYTTSIPKFKIYIIFSK